MTTHTLDSAPAAPRFELVRHLRQVWPLVAVAAVSVGVVPETPLRLLGPLTVALLLGVLLRRTPGVRTVPRSSVVWLSREVLRAGVVLTGVRLDWVLLARAGAAPIVVATTAVVVGFGLFSVLQRLLGVPLVSELSSRLAPVSAAPPRSRPPDRWSERPTKRPTSGSRS